MYSTHLAFWSRKSSESSGLYHSPTGHKLSKLSGMVQLIPEPDRFSPESLTLLWSCCTGQSYRKPSKPTPGPRTSLLLSAHFLSLRHWDEEIYSLRSCERWCKITEEGPETLGHQRKRRNGIQSTASFLWVCHLHGAKGFQSDYPGFQLQSLFCPSNTDLLRYISVSRQPCTCAQSGLEFSLLKSR